MLDEPTTKRLKDITVPTNLIFGEKDGLIPNPILHGGCSRDVAQIALDAIPGATLTMIPEAGHLLMIEKAEDFDRIILGILRP
jgi:pimeloyl-ACP methyl ester carboxylesterase